MTQSNLVTASGTVLDRTSGKSFTIQNPLLPKKLPDLRFRQHYVLFDKRLPRLDLAKNVGKIKLDKNAREYRVFKTHKHSTSPFLTGFEEFFRLSWLQNLLEPGKTSQSQAQAAANLFLSDHLPDRFTADKPCLSVAEKSEKYWEVPIIFTFPNIGNLGQVGTILVSMNAENILSYTSIEEMKKAGQKLYEIYRDAIQSHFL